MKKDFKKWHTYKERIHTAVARPFFHIREIWFCTLGANVGFEQDGVGEDFLRPIVIVKKFNNEIFLGIPLTKAKKKVRETAEPYYYVFSFINKIKSAAILSQIRLIDAKRLVRHIGTISEANFKDLTKKLKELFP